MGTVAFHADDAVDDGELARKGGMEVGYGFVDAGPVERVLGPSIDSARHHSEEVFHGQGGRHPVMGLHLGMETSRSAPKAVLGR